MEKFPISKDFDSSKGDADVGEKLEPERLREKREQVIEKLVCAKLHAAHLYAEFEKTVRKNPDISSDALYDSLYEHFNDPDVPELRLAADKAADMYAKQREAITGLLKEFPDPRDLFFRLFGIDPQGRVDVVEGPFMLYFVCDDPRDYNLFFDGDYYGSESSSGVYVGADRLSDVLCPIGAERFSSHYYDDHSASLMDSDTYRHEEQHAIRDLLFRATQETAFDDKSPLDLPHTPENVVSFVKQKALGIRSRFLDHRLADEILAFSAEPTPSSSTYIENTLCDPEGLYAYLDEHDVSRFVDEIQQGFEEGLHPEIEHAAREVFEVDRRKLVREGILSYRILEASGLSFDEIAGVLALTPLPQWLGTAQRIQSHMFPGQEGGSSRHLLEDVKEEGIDSLYNSFGDDIAVADDASVRKSHSRRKKSGGRRKE